MSLRSDATEKKLTRGRIFRKTWTLVQQKRVLRGHAEIRFDAAVDMQPRVGIYRGRYALRSDALEEGWLSERT